MIVIAPFLHLSSLKNNIILIINNINTQQNLKKMEDNFFGSLSPSLVTQRVKWSQYFWMIFS